MHFQSQMKTDGEVVYTMTNFYDGPAEGIADYEGRPHAYVRTFDDLRDIHEDGDLFELWPVDEDTWRLALEDWAIWERWEVAFHGKRTELDTHPALPEDRPRHEALDSVLKARLAPPEEGKVLARGQFRRREAHGAPREGMGLKVWWTSNDAYCG